jgi:hypothetical protein
MSSIANGPPRQFSAGTWSVDRRYFRLDLLAHQDFAYALERTGMEASCAPSRRINN